jgi:OmcA/MtrC family decaheme c-type cytochrome
MQKRMRKYGGALFFAGMLALAGCQGEKGADGKNGNDGTNGTDLTAAAKAESCSVCHPDAGAEHQGIYNSFRDGLDPATSKLAASIVGATSSDNGNGTFTSTVTFTVSKNGTGLTLAELKALKQKTMYAVTYTPGAAGANGTFEKEKAFSFDVKTAVASGGQFTITKTDAPFAPENAASGFLYGYFGDTVVIPTSKGHYALMDNVISAAKTYGAAIGYASSAKVSGCEQCHPKPYSKHGYRQAHVAGLPDFVSCKACHFDNKGGIDYNLQLAQSDPALMLERQALPPVGGEPDWGTTVETKYAYNMTVMNDTHMSHAMEFAYPQSMANCTTCHDVSKILIEANFTPATCRSCHPETVAANAQVTAGRAPALSAIMPASVHTGVNISATAPANACNGCHGDGSSRSFKAIHSGYDKAIYAADGSKYSAAIKAQVGATSFDATTNKLTVSFSIAGAAAQALIKPTVVVSLYGYDTKDFIVSGHGSAADGTSLLEFTEGATQRSDPTKSANGPRLTVTPAMTPGNTTWTATADLTTWAAMLADKSVKRVEIAILPAVGLDQTVAPQNDAAKAGYNPFIAVAGTTATIDLATGNVVANAYGKAIVDAAKCNACHEALGTTFHTPNYGSAGVVGCRLCHTVMSGGSHLEMQSRSIDSYVHAIHSYQYFDVKNVKFSDAVAAFRYQEHTEESTYPSFSILNCESCHVAGTYDVPDQARSLPGLLSASATVQKDRAIGTVPSYVTGPASRACGSCHRAQAINEDDANKLASLNAHTGAFGTLIENSTGVLDGAIKKIMSLF